MIGGGFRDSRVGELAIGRAAVILKADEVDIDLVPIRNDPDEAGLIGAAHLAPRWMFEAHDAILAVDIGGTNIRAGVVELNLKKAPDLSEGRRLEIRAVAARRRGERHARGRGRDAGRTCSKRLIARADKEGLQARAVHRHRLSRHHRARTARSSAARRTCRATGRAAASTCRRSLHEAIPTIGEHDTVVLMHNDAVVQGLSEVPFMQDVEHWGVLTIGTGLGNARFTNRKSAETIAALPTTVTALTPPRSPPQ